MIEGSCLEDLITLNLVSTSFLGQKSFISNLRLPSTSLCFKTCYYLPLLKYRWSASEVRNATGYSNVMVARHPLKLSSSYAILKVVFCSENGSTL
jgi:hypothetical protein